MNNDVKYSCTVTPKVLTNNDDDFLERFCFEIPKCANIPAPYIKTTNDCSYFSSWYENINSYNNYIDFMCCYKGFLI